MRKMTIEMPLVSKCEVTQCAYNQEQSCHARAITIGDEETPNCDTYFQASRHARSVDRQAGVGACKVGSCTYNQDFECMTDGITVAREGDVLGCMTYRPA